MNITKMLVKLLPATEEVVKPSKGKVILKTALITGAVLAFVPTVFKINGDEGFDGYGLLSHLKYEKKIDAEGKVQHAWFYALVDLSRFIKKNNMNEVEVKNDEDSSCVEE